MKINLETLISSVQERFYDMESYYHKYNGDSCYPKKDLASYHYHERAAHYGENFIFDVCQILNIDLSRLYSLARAARKWEERRNWQRSFPAEEHAEQILRYLQA